MCLQTTLQTAKRRGYRAERVVSQTFEQELVEQIGGNAKREIGSGAPIRLIRDVPVNFETSTITQTGRSLDLRSTGKAFSISGERNISC
jgi:hypothetical protein